MCCLLKASVCGALVLTYDAGGEMVVGRREPGGATGAVAVVLGWMHRVDASL